MSSAQKKSEKDSTATTTTAANTASEEVKTEDKKRPRKNQQTSNHTVPSQNATAEHTGDTNHTKPERHVQPPSSTTIEKNNKKTTNTKKQSTLESRLDYACEALGFDKRNLGQIEVIDFCLDDIVRIDWLIHFPYLKELTIVNQGINEIEGIDRCKALEKVWLTANYIEVIRQIDRLPLLKELYLGSNKIRRIRCLDKLINLEKLWLDENRIEQIDGIQNLTNLVELNLARNNIEVINVGLDGLINLKDLNLSANRIGNFKEVLNLNRLPALTTCTFSDQHYGENPICSLCNYQTYMLFHLPRLTQLDTMIVSEESKTFAETTFMKKRMYYNMRIKTIQRNTSNIMKLLKICRKVRIAKLDIDQSKLLKKLLEISREIEERQFIDQNNKDDFASVFTYGPEKLVQNPLDQVDNEELRNQIESKKALLNGRIHDKNEDQKDLEAMYESLCQKIYGMSEQNIHRLLTELETGGNIRFEEGRASDRWFSSCVDLVRSRFSAEQMRDFGIIGINVTRVTRIHNRFLRNRFEEKLEQLVDLSDNQYRRSLEYLFYGVNPSAPSEIFRAMEEGFRSSSEYQEAGLPGCVSLVNGVASAEIPRINAFLNTEDGSAQIRSAALAQKNTDFRANQDLAVERGLVQIPSGQLLVCKIFLQRCTHDSNHPHFDPSQSPSEIWRHAPVDERRNPGVQSVYRTKESDPRQRMWFVLDHALALPEYLVEFDYITDPMSVSENRRLAEPNVINQECNNLFKGITETQRVLQTTHQWVQKQGKRQQAISLNAQDLDRSDMGCLKRPLHSFMVKCHIQELIENHYEFPQNPNDGQTAVENSLPPEIPLRSQLEHLTEAVICAVSRQQQIGQIQYLNLFNNKIKQIKNLEGLVSVHTLILSFNEIEEIQGLQNCQKLTKLDLNHNFIRQVKNLAGLNKLKHLDLRHNWISDLNQLEHVAKECGDLEELGLKCNPISSKQSYRAQVFKRVGSIKKLDGLTLSDRDQENVEKGERELSHDIIVANFKSQKKHLDFSEHPKKSSSNKHEEQKDELKEGQVPVEGVIGLPLASNAWEHQIEELVLNHQQISKIQNLDRLVNLRKLKLLDNCITEIEGLENLRLLEELSLEKNKLTVIQNLEHLKYLKKLDLGSNKIKRIFNVQTLSSLTQLSLENNEISRLDGLEQLQCLMELYLGNNLISDVKETIKLKDLQRLIILDISGNLMSSSFGNNYRIYCIFHLRKLRVLDGMSIDNTEHIEAKETFSGRLTEEILTSRLHGRRLRDITELDLSSCKLRDFEDMFDQSTCPNLRDLNLSNNFMSSMRGFGHLPLLKILKLRDNKIETLFCKPNPEEGRHYKRGLFGLPALEYLDVSKNCLQYLYGLQYSPLKELQILHAQNNEIVKIEHLEKLKQLRELDLSKNRIRQIEMNSFHPFHQIVILKLDDNGLRSLGNIEKLEKVQTLYLSSNRISEFVEIEKLLELPQLLDLSLLANPIARKPNYRMMVIKRLGQLIVFDGKEISIEERKRIEGAAGLLENKQMPPLVHFQQYPTVKVPVKLNPVNFDGVFNNMRFQNEQNTPSQQLDQRQMGPPSASGRGFGGGGQQDMQNLIQVQSIHMGAGQGSSVNNPGGMGQGTNGAGGYSQHLNGTSSQNNHYYNQNNNQGGSEQRGAVYEHSNGQHYLAVGGQAQAAAYGEHQMGADPSNQNRQRPNLQRPSTNKVNQVEEQKQHHYKRYYQENQRR